MNGAAEAAAATLQHRRSAAGTSGVGAAESTAAFDTGYLNAGGFGRGGFACGGGAAAVGWQEVMSGGCAGVWGWRGGGGPGALGPPSWRRNEAVRRRGEGRPLPGRQWGPAAGLGGSTARPKQLNSIGGAGGAAAAGACSDGGPCRGLFQGIDEALSAIKLLQHGLTHPLNLWA